MAGNAVHDVVLGSIAYAVEHLHLSLLMVLGHERCAAVEVALRAGEAPGYIAGVVGAIRPAVEKVKGQPGDLLDHAVRANVEMAVAHLRASPPVLSEMVRAGKLMIVGARYDLDSGWVDIIA